MKNDYFYQSADKSLVGLTELVVPLGVAHCSVAALTTLITDSKQARLDYKNAQHGKQQAFDALRKARSTVDPFIRRTRDYLVGVLGPVWNAGWSVVGFASRSLALPDTDAHRITVLQLTRDYFTANAAKQASQLNVTAAEATAQLAAFSAAKAAAEACRFDQRSKRDLRDTAEVALDKKLRCLWTELGSILDPLDPRWLKFIDRVPGDLRVPDAVEEVSAEAQPGGIITVDWEDATRAARYKVLKQVIGVDVEPVLFTTVDGSDAQITGVPSGATVKLQIVATNAVGDAPASEVIQLQAA